LRRDLARQVDAGPRAEAPVARVFEQRGEAELQAELVKKDVAALGDRLLEGQVAVSRGGPAAKVAVAVLQPAPAGDGHVAVQRDDAALQRPRSERELAGRPWWVVGLDCRGHEGW